MLLQNIFVFAIASLSENQAINVFEIVLVGFLFVFCILLILSLTTWLFGKVFVHISVKKTSSSIVSNAAVLPASDEHASTDRTKESDPDVNDPRCIAVIAAAIHCVMGDREHRIVSISSSDSKWAAEGRRQIFSSHRVR